MLGHKQRVGCMSWSHHTLATGSRDRTILMRDVRTQVGSGGGAGGRGWRRRGSKVMPC